MLKTAMGSRNLGKKSIQIFSQNGQKLINIGSLALVHSKPKRPDLTRVTHTGQVWAEDDYRNVRFTNAKRYVNLNWSANMATHFQPIVTTKRIVHCDGGGLLGHPRVYICMDKPAPCYCFYCGQEFWNASFAKKQV